MEFTEDEVREKLRQLGYHDVPRTKLIEFMADLEELIQLDLSGCTTSSTLTEVDVSQLGNSTIGENTSHDDSTTKVLRENMLHDDSTTKVRQKAFAKEKIRPSSHHISFDKENISLFDREDIPVFDSTHGSLSSTLLSGDEEIPKKQPPDPTAMKRKVVRRRDGSSRIFDESVTTNDDSVLSDITALEDQVRNLPISDDDRLTTSVSRPSSASTYRKQPRSKSASSINSTSSLLSENNPSGALPSFIRSSHVHPHTKNLMKCDPVARFHQFNREWQRGNVPGESGHSGLRWNVREKMLHCEVFEKPRRQHTTNDYVVPTEKKRQALRWKVRTAMANIS